MNLKECGNLDVTVWGVWGRGTWVKPLFLI